MYGAIKRRRIFVVLYSAHDFFEQLEFSHECADAPFWEVVYRRAFPNLAALVNVRKDGWAQRGGIDRQLILSSGRAIAVDEKVRKRSWPDFALERWSDRDRRVPGWVQKPL